MRLRIAHSVTSLFLLLCVMLVMCSLGNAQSLIRAKDTTMVFGNLTPSANQNQLQLPNSAMGIDLLVSTNGFGLGTFFRHEYSDNLAGYIDFSISEAKDDNETEYIDSYSGQTFVPGKINRFLLMPLFVGLQERFFRDDILDNFRPYLNAAIGPAMIFVFPYNDEYFNALGKGHPQYTFGGYIGGGAFFGTERSSLFGIDLRYYVIPYTGGITSMQKKNELVTKDQFGGFYITFNFGSAW